MRMLNEKESHHMKPKAHLTRRDFISSTSAFLLAGELAAQETKAPSAEPNPDKLALEGGEKAVKRPAGKPVRWGEPERLQFNEMLKQDSLLYWKAPQTTLLIQRFKEHYPFQHVMTCSSGTAALHIPVAARYIA